MRQIPQKLNFWFWGLMVGCSEWLCLGRFAAGDRCLEVPKLAFFSWGVALFSWMLSCHTKTCYLRKFSSNKRGVKGGGLWVFIFQHFGLRICSSDSWDLKLLGYSDALWKLHKNKKQHGSRSFCQLGRNIFRVMLPGWAIPTFWKGLGWVSFHLALKRCEKHPGPPHPKISRSTALWRLSDHSRMELPKASYLNERTTNMA